MGAILYSSFHQGETPTGAMGECSLDRQNTVVENLGVSHIGSQADRRRQAGHFLIRWQKLATQGPQEPGVPILEDQRMDLKEQRRGCEKRDSQHCWQEYQKLMQPQWRAVIQDFLKTKNRWSYDPVIPFLGIYSREKLSDSKIHVPQCSCQHYLQLVTWKPPSCQWVDEWIKKT